LILYKYMKTPSSQDKTQTNKQMEEEDPRSETVDEALQKKHNDMLERFSARHQARKSDSASSSSTFESTSSFLSQFADSKRSIESRIADLRLASSSEDSSKIKSDLAELVAANSYFLPSYEVRSSLRSASDLKQSLDALSAALLPKKKFSFKSKQSSAAAAATKIQKRDLVSPPTNVVVRDSPGFRNKRGETLSKSFRSSSSIGEFTLSDLDSCRVHLTGTVNALFIHRLRNCSVYTGPVLGSILIDDVDDCVLVAASHQIRIHRAKRSDFYLRVRSRPIIEDSNGVRFGPYCLGYGGIEEDLKTAGLEEDTESWANVDDFLWLRALHSPNWSILPQEERLSSVSISGLGGDSS
ncbi:hypothetical protein HID58_013410, partial [Brassica napus]